MTARFASHVLVIPARPAPSLRYPDAMMSRAVFVWLATGWCAALSVILLVTIAIRLFG